MILSSSEKVQHIGFYAANCICCSGNENHVVYYVGEFQKIYGVSVHSKEELVGICDFCGSKYGGRIHQADVFTTEEVISRARHPKPLLVSYLNRLGIFNVSGGLGSIIGLVIGSLMGLLIWYIFCFFTDNAVVTENSAGFLASLIMMIIGSIIGNIMFSRCMAKRIFKKKIKYVIAKFNIKLEQFMEEIRNAEYPTAVCSVIYDISSSEI